MNKPLYELDEHEWLLQQVGLLEEGKLAELDQKNLTQYLLEIFG